jgi:hypothetical protein
MAGVGGSTATPQAAGGLDRPPEQLHRVLDRQRLAEVRFRA